MGNNPVCYRDPDGRFAIGIPIIPFPYFVPSNTNVNSWGTWKDDFRAAEAYDFDLISPNNFLKQLTTAGRTKNLIDLLTKEYIKTCYEMSIR